MRLIEPSFEIIEQEDLYKHIELCGRTCYKSTDKITEESAKPFVDRMINSKHYAMLEHGTVYLKGCPIEVAEHYRLTKYSKAVWKRHDHMLETCRCDTPEEDGWYVTTNLRVIIENGWESDLQYMCEPTKYHAKRYTVKFICNRQVSHEFVRHRVFSFAQESTRYCNYSKDKFEHGLTFIIPNWTSLNPGFYEQYTNTSYSWIDDNNVDHEIIMKTDDDEQPISTDDILLSYFFECDWQYINLIQKEWQPQQAATILPNALKTELIMTGFAEDWEHFFDLRALGKTGAPHPQAKQLAMPLYEEFINRGYINAR